MSFATFLEIQYVENSINIDAISEDVEKLLTDNGIHKDVVSDLRAAFEGQETMFNVSASFLAFLIERIAALQPSTSFHARGRGEELRDVWVREFEGGEVIFSQGSFL